MMVIKRKRQLPYILSIILAICITASLAPGNGMRVQAADKKEIVIVYFSATGTTKAVARKIRNATGGKLIEIKAADPYTEADLDYNDPDSRVSTEDESAATHRKSSVRPEIKNLKRIRKLIKAADVVYIGYPIWFGEAPHILYTLVENVSLKNKTVVPFCTSASSGVGNSASSLKKSANISSKTNWLKGKSFYGIPSQKAVSRWIKKIEY